MLFRNSDPRLLWRYILIGSALTVIFYSLWGLAEVIWKSPPGAYELRQGDQALAAGDYDRALAAFDRALQEVPDHSGAAMGRAISLMQLDRQAEAEQAFDGLIANLQNRPNAEDRAKALAIAFSNRGVLKDRLGRHAEALDDYLKALGADAEAVSGPGLIDRLLYANPEPSTVRDRARYLYEEFQKPEDQQRLSLPERDVLERMHRP